MLVHRTLLLWIRNFLKGHGQFDKGHGQFWIRACVHVQCKQVELCRFRYGTEFVRTCVDVVSNYMYQSNNFFGVVQLFKTTTLSSVCIQTLVNLFWNSRQFTHYNNKLERQHSCITSQVTYGLILMSVKCRYRKPTWRSFMSIFKKMKLLFRRTKSGNFDRH